MVVWRLYKNWMDVLKSRKMDAYEKFHSPKNFKNKYHSRLWDKKKTPQNNNQKPCENVSYGDLSIWLYKKSAGNDC